MVEWLHLFNALPAELRDITVSKEVMKRKLDLFLSEIPDKPRVPHLEPAPMGSHGQQSNLVRDWIDHFNLKNWTSTVATDASDAAISSFDAVLVSRVLTTTVVVAVSNRINTCNYPIRDCCQWQLSVCDKSFSVIN